jgi:hypothetical protein
VPLQRSFASQIENFAQRSIRGVNMGFLALDDLNFNVANPTGHASCNFQGLNAAAMIHFTSEKMIL